MKILQNERFRHWCAFIILFSVGFLLGLGYDPSIVLPERDWCAICDADPQRVPCLLNADTGEIGCLAGTSASGVFQYLICGELTGAWDSDSQTGWLSLPQSKNSIDPSCFCRSCRNLLAETIPGSYAILDISDPKAPQIYPPATGATYQILQYSVSIQNDNGAALLRTSLL